MPFLAAIPLAYVAIAGTVASAAVGAAGAIQSSQAQSSAAKYQAQVATNNQTIASQNATLAGQQSDAKAQADYRSGAIRLGAQRAALGADGGTLDTGSAADVQRQTAEYTQLGVNQDQYQGDLSQYSLRVQGGNYQAQSQLDHATAANASTAGYMGAGGSLLSGASQFASKWNSYYGGGQMIGPAGYTGPDGSGGQWV